MTALEREVEYLMSVLAEARKRRDKLRAELERALQRADDNETAETELAKCS